jgi:Na+-transporting NADH:ubiquinone oxidoreductase subunit NqrA
MNSTDYYSIPFRNQVHLLKVELVKELLKISEYNGSDIPLIIKTKNSGEIIGTVKEFQGYNPMGVEDIYIPIVFKIETNEVVKEINFLEVESIKIEN